MAIIYNTMLTMMMHSTDHTIERVSEEERWHERLWNPEATGIHCNKQSTQTAMNINEPGRVKPCTPMLIINSPNKEQSSVTSVAKRQL